MGIRYSLFCIERCRCSYKEPTNVASCFSECSNKSSLLLVLKGDGIKNQYCKHRNIDLLRIPYWEKDNIAQILYDKLNIY